MVKDLLANAGDPRDMGFSTGSGRSPGVGNGNPLPWTARRSNQSILKEISPGISLEGMMLKLKTPVVWPPHVKS